MSFSGCVLFKLKKLTQLSMMNQPRFYSQMGDLGGGAGKGGGGGGSIRNAGGAFGKIEAGREEEYFYKMKKEQLEKLKASIDHDIHYHEAQIKKHQEAIEHAKSTAEEIHK